MRQRIRIHLYIACVRKNPHQPNYRSTRHPSVVWLKGGLECNPERSFTINRESFKSPPLAKVFQDLWQSVAWRKTLYDFARFWVKRKECGGCFVYNPWRTTRIDGDPFRISHQLLTRLLHALTGRCAATPQTSTNRKSTYGLIPISLLRLPEED